MLKSIIFLLKNCEMPDTGSFADAGVYVVPSGTPSAFADKSPDCSPDRAATPSAFADKSPDCSLGRAAMPEALPPSPEGALVVTDDAKVMANAKKRGFAVIFCSGGGAYAEGAEYVAEEAAAVDYAYADTAYRRMRGIPLTVLETARTVVREMTLEDLPELYRIYDDDEIRKYVGRLGEYEEEKKSLESYIRSAYGFYGFGLWAVTEKGSGRLIGRAGVSLREIDGESRMELGYLIAREYRRRGYALEVCGAIKSYAFERLEAGEIYIVTRPDNTASVRTAEKLGFGRPSFSEINGCEYMIFQCKE